MYNTFAKHALLFGLSLTLATSSIAQQANPDPVKRGTNREKLRNLAIQWEQADRKSLKRAIQFAKEHNMPIRKTFEDGTTIEIQGMGADSLPYYYTTHNQDAAATISTDEVNPGGSLGLDLTGAGMMAGVWDSDAVLSTHQEFGNRVSQGDSETSTSDHATHVAGTIIAQGIKSQARGMAYQAALEAYDWSFDESEMANAASNGLLISNHSYGQITGFRYNSDSSRWEWYGDPNVSPLEEYEFGFYTAETKRWDQIAQNAPHYLIVKSAGNDRNDDGPSSGDPHYIRNNQGEWVESTVNREPDGNYDCIGPKATAKNLLTVGAVKDIPGGYQDPSDVNLSGFSSWGPTDDGRIKPDLVANGVGLFSTTDEDDTSYTNKSGTSMSSPSVTGSLLLLQEHYQDSQSSGPMWAATLKALAIHSADEAGPAPGPDYEHGWGLMNTQKAASIISNLGNNTLLREITLNNNSNATFKVTASGNDPLMATICWNDEPGTPPAASLDPTDKMLVNDLDLRILDASSNASMPWVMNPSNPSSPASRGDNSTDNVEQVLIDNPTPGETYTIKIDHKNQLYQQQGQPVSLIVTGMESQIAQTYCQDTIAVQADVGMIEDGSQNELYGNNSDCYWHVQSQSGNTLTLDFLEFSTESGQDSLYIYSGNSTEGELIGSYSGNQVPEDLATNYESLFLHFKTNNLIKDEGWQIRFTSYEQDVCGAPYFMDYLSEDPADAGYIFEMNQHYNQNNVSNAYQVREVGTAFKDWISSNEGTFTPDFPVKLDSVRAYVTHENNSGQNDTFQLYVQGLNSNNYPSGPVLWEGNVTTSESLSPSGDWNNGSSILANISFQPELIIDEPFFIGLRYKGPLEDTASILAYHQNVGTAQNHEATEADYGIAYRKHPFYGSDWLPEPDGTEQVFHDHNDNQTYDRGTNEAHLMQVLGIVPVVTEPYKLDTPVILADTSGDGTVTLSSNQTYPNYQWYLDGEKLNSANGKTYQPTEDGNYQVVGYDETGCNVVSDPFAYDHNTSIRQVNQSPEVQIYPNPGNGLFNWEISSSPNIEFQIVVTDIAGGKVLQETVRGKTGQQSRKGTLDLMHLSKGTYFVEFSGDRINQIKRLIIQ